jgi:hypothetical protein
MSKNLIIALVVILGVGALVYFKVGMKNDRMVGGVVSYTCESNKTFSLTYVDKNTVTLSGTGITSISLDENAAGFWVSADGKTTAKTVGTYAVVVQNNKTTHDRCVVK